MTAPSPRGHDSGGVPRSGRELTGTGFDGDLGEADVDLLEALDDPQDETALMHAVAHARLLVPIVVAPTEVDSSGDLMAEKFALNRATDMAVVTLTLPDGQRAFPVFTSLVALAAWDAGARPSPVASSRAAQAAVTERCDVMLLDCGSGHERVLRPSMVWALAQQRDWLPAHTDPFVTQALSRATDGVARARIDGLVFTIRQADLP
ncbi:MAG: SseB family protein [Actinobacteria bacterium]|nr:SseB family protein [Actinomycetota bacterium]